MITGHETCHHKIYALDCTEYDALLNRAAGRCELCAVPAGQVHRGKLVIDHESRLDYLAVRGLLCQRCNAHMRRVDSGERPIDAQTFAYLDLAGHFVPQGFRPHLRFTGSRTEVRAELLRAIASADAAQGGSRARPRLACAPRVVTAPW